MAVEARARSDSEKTERRAAIVAAARSLFAETDYAAVRMAEVAGRAGLAKGTVFLYFPTKESLFLAVLQDLLAAWFVEVEAALAASGRWDASRVARTIAASLAGQRRLVELLALLSGVIERNVEVEEVARFKEWLLVRLAAAGAALERRLPWLRASEGARLWLHIDAAIVGLHQLAEPGPIARLALMRPHLHPLAVDFGEELTALLSSLLLGHEVAAKQGRRPRKTGKKGGQHE